MNGPLKVAFFLLSVCVVMLSQSASPPPLVDGVLSDTKLGFRYTPPPKMFDETDSARESVLATLEFSGQPHSYLGFDRNDYPGDDSLNELHKAFDYTGYWLNSPPGAKANTWIGKRKRLQTAGFGFLVLFNGRLYSELRTIDAAAKLGTADAQSAVAAARREGFPDSSIIFLDQEQGGRMLPEQKAYLFAWVDGV